MARPSLPPGFRFHPTDVEVVKYYLKRKVMGKGFPFEAISELNIYNYSPWDLPDKSCLKSKDLEWYFFCPAARKYSSGARSKRSTEIGFWKSTGKDRSVLYNEQTVGSVKTLVFHRGHAPKGERTDWLMYEYKIKEKDLADAGVPQDAYVLCKIFQKSGRGPKANAQYGAPFKEEDWDDDAEFCDQSLQSISLPSPALPYDKFIPGSMGSAPLSMPGPSNILSSIDVVAQPGPENEDYITLWDIDKEYSSSLPDHTVNNELVENFSQVNNNVGLTGLDGNGIYDNLEDLDNWQGMMDEGGFNFSSNQTTEYDAMLFSGGNNEGFVELNDLDGTVKSSNSRQFIPDYIYVPDNDNYMEQDCVPANSFSNVHPVSAITQLPLQPEGSNGRYDHFFAFQEMGDADSANLGFTATSGIQNLPPLEQPEEGTRQAAQDQNRGGQQRKPYSRLQRLLESIPARSALAAELFAPANKRCNETIVFSPYGGSSHVKAEVTRMGGACTKDALSENLGESPNSYSGFTLSTTGFGKEVKCGVKCGSRLRIFFGLGIVSTLVWVFLVRIISKFGRHAWNFVNW
ncbi:NAC domain-containing protein 82-like [Actinidia eriantha]|uniref:NAC domain-containing protein 82-like n=1 Tax=Actinidia eriantha TaxID=165200 RepID=UPI002584FB82|nr:NAC domain-containing protein 82-like [Actinidia eriantha]